MTTSNLSTVLTATLPSATNTVLGGILVDSTTAGLHMLSTGNLAAKVDGYTTNINSSGALEVNVSGIADGATITVNGSNQLEVSPTYMSSTLSAYLPLSGGELSGSLFVDDSVSGNILKLFADSTGAWFQINPANPTGTGGIIFTDGTVQETAFNPLTSAYYLDGATSNTGSLVSMLASGDFDAGGTDTNCQIVQYSTLQTGSINITFPTPDHDGQLLEIVIINGSGAYTASGLALDGTSSATVFLNLGTGAYCQGAFRYIDSTMTWYQVS